MYSASSGLSSCSLLATSFRDILAYDRLIMRTPVLITLCLRRIINVYVPSPSNWGPKFSSTSLNLPKLPVLTAENGQESKDTNQNSIKMYTIC